MRPTIQKNDGAGRGARPSVSANSKRSARAEEGPRDGQAAADRQTAEITGGQSKQIAEGTGPAKRIAGSTVGGQGKRIAGAPASRKRMQGTSVRDDLPFVDSAHATADEILAVAEARAPKPSAEAPAGAGSAEPLTCDVVIVGCGVAGCFAALHLPRALSVVMLSKGDLDECDSMLAQGGICVLHDAQDYDLFFEDTLRAGHYENRAESVDIMIRSSRGVIDELQRRGVRFAATETGDLAYTREGAHSRARICYHEDITGREITTVLQRDVKALPNVRILEHTTMTDLVEGPGGACTGVTCADAAGRPFEIRARDTVLACGGIGGLYARSTNFPLLTGDGCRAARDHGVALEHMDYVQIHPTSLYTRKPGRSFLISESARGEGAVLLNAHGERFTDELQPRDIVSNVIYRQMEADGTDHVLLSFEHMPAATIRGHFPHIWERCLEEGCDITKEPVPVVPAQHYFMGGIHVDRNSATTMPHLYAAGETSCNGVHGKNRLASNSLLESLVFAERAAQIIGHEQTGAPLPDRFDAIGKDAAAYAEARWPRAYANKASIAAATEQEDSNTDQGSSAAPAFDSASASHDAAPQGKEA